MIAKFVVLTVLAFVTPQILPGVRVRGWGTAAAVALLFGLLNLLIGWLLSILLTVLSLPLLLITFGLFAIVVTTVVNAILLRLTDRLLDSFELPGWGAAFGMGFLFALGATVAEWITR